jgi:hypothetical protein
VPTGIVEDMERRVAERNADVNGQARKPALRGRTALA